MGMKGPSASVETFFVRNACYCEQNDVTLGSKSRIRHVSHDKEYHMPGNNRRKELL